MKSSSKSNLIPILIVRAASSIRNANPKKDEKEKENCEPGDDGAGVGFDGVVGDSLVEVSQNLRQGPRDAGRRRRPRVQRNHVIRDRHSLLLITAAGAAAADDDVRVRVRPLVLQSTNGKQEPSLLALEEQSRARDRRGRS